MNYSSEERWSALRQLYEVYAISAHILAVASNRSISAVERKAKNENWLRQGIETYEPDKLANLVSRLVMTAERLLNDLIDGKPITPKSEKYLQYILSIATTSQKSLALQLELLKQSARSGNNRAGDESAHTGEDILALRAEIEAFIDSIGEEEVDPALSADPE